LDDLTIVRLRGELIVYLSALDLVAEGFRWFFGICIVSENAAAIGVTAIPSPLADIAWDGWFVYETGTLESASGTIGNSENIGMINDRRTVDSKAMRKVHNTDVVVAVLETSELGDGSTMHASFSSRMLSKLP